MWAGAAAAAVFALLVGASSAGAKTYEVTRHNDPQPGKCKANDCSLREAVRAANKRPGRDVVVLPDRRTRYELARANEAPLLDEDASEVGDLDITGGLTLRHPGRGMATIDANAVDRVIEVQAPTLLKRVRVTGGGNVSQDPPRAAHRTSTVGSGGGIESHGPLTLKRSAVVRNLGAATGGGINVEPSFEPGAGPASLRLVRSTIARNRAIEGTGGGIQGFGSRVTIVRSRVVGNNADNAGGGVYVNTDGVLRLLRSTVAGNRARYDPGGVYIYQAEATIRQSTISGNVALEVSGGGGAGIGASANSKLDIANATVAGNRTPADGGGIASSLTGDVTLRSVTVARNRAAGAGGGLLNGGGAADWDVVNSIIALNESGDGTDDCSGGFNTGGGNLLGNGTGCNFLGIPAGPDIFGVDPKLGRLKRNGGPTKTTALRKGSPAIGKAVKAAAPRRDQRGVKRDNKPDIGAYER